VPAEIMPDADVIPVIDLGPYFAGEAGALDRAASELRHALTEIGFYSIVNHGVPSALVHEVYRQVARFHARPLDEKLKIKLDKHNVGYLPMMGDTLRTSVVAQVTKPNMSEAFFMARDLAADHPDVVSGRRFRSANQWPESLPGFREPLVEYCDALERLVQRLVRVYARALDLPATYFDRPFTDFQYKLRATHYPSQPEASDDEFGIAPHTDTSFLTLLAPNDVPGLAFRTQTGDWIDVPTVRDAFIVNGGQLLLRWTNDTFLATAHRAVNRTGDERYALAFFCDAQIDWPIAAVPTCVGPLRPPRYETTYYTDYMIGYQARTYNVFGDQTKDAAE
jgi:isopenicillin N synthase-like dioxygenase